MNILLIGQRKWFYPSTTTGLLRVKYDNAPLEREPLCYTLEDTVRPSGIKVQDNTAIPSDILLNLGTRYSAHLKREVLILYNQKDGITISHAGIKFTYVYFHALNNNKQTDGCVGVGMKIDGNTIYEAEKAEIMLFNKVKVWLGNGHTVQAVFHNVPNKG